MQLAKIIDGELVTTFANEEDREMINTMVSDGFKIFVEEDKPATELAEFQSLVVRYQEDAHQITAYHDIVDNDPQKIIAEIERLKSELSSTDYKIIKSYEYTLTGEEPPYDIRELHLYRQNLRGLITHLESIT